MQCSRCEAENPRPAGACRHCGAPLGGSSVLPAGAAPRREVEGQRRQVTVLCADLQGYTPLAEALGEEAVYDLMNRVYETMLQAVQRYEGTVQELTGDGVLVLFGAPIAQEDAPLRACQAALAMQEGMRRLAAEVERERGVRLAARIGIHSGPVVVGAVGSDLRTEVKAVGDTVNLAARLQMMAEPGCILLSEATQALVEGLVECTFLGEREVKGKAAAQPVWRLDALRPAPERFATAVHRGLSPFVGRQADLERLERCLREARAGVTRVIHLVGEAGIGKTRLLWELQQRLAGEAVLFLLGHCASYGRGTAFLPFIEIVRGAFRLAAGDAPDEVRRKLGRGLERLGLKADELLPYLLNLLGLPAADGALRGLDGEIIGARTRDAIVQIVHGRCHLSPVVLVVDDLHWVDRASEDLLGRMVARAEPLPLLVLFAFRPDYRPPWAGAFGVTEIRLAPLAAESVARLARERLATAPAHLEQLVVQKAEGNPLVAEELTRYLIEAGSSTRPGTGDRPSQLPASLEALVLARVDQLPEPARALLQVASVIGRRFSVEVLAAVTGHGEDLTARLRELEARELLFRDGADAAAYSFRHVLVQEALYSSLLRPRRQELHQRVAEALEGLHAGRLQEWAEILAEHWGQTSRAERAVPYLAQAGRKSLSVYALDEAHDRFQRAVELLERHPESGDDHLLASVLLDWVRVHYYRKDFRALVGLVERFLPRLEALGPTREAAFLHFWLGFSHTMAGRAALARAALDRADAMARALGDDECQAYVDMARLYLVIYWAWIPGADRERLADRALAAAERLGDIYVISKVMLARALDALSSGYPERGRSFALRLLRLGREAHDPRAAAMGLWALAFVNGYDERGEAAIEHAEEALLLSPDPLDRVSARAAKGTALAFLGRGREAFALLRSAREECVAGDFLVVLTGIDIPYGLALVQTGAVAAGVRWIEETMRRWGGGNPTLIGLGHLALGEIYLEMATGGRRPPARVVLDNLGFLLRVLPLARRRARAHLVEALRVTRELDMRLWEARTRFLLGRLEASRGRAREARQAFEEAERLAREVGGGLADTIARTRVTGR